MQYLVVFQLLCGAFSAFVAGRKGRSRAAWWLIGAFVPVFGVLLSLMVPEASGAPVTKVRRRRLQATDEVARPTDRSKRCKGSYMPDCLGCPYFRRCLFDATGQGRMRGTCSYFGKVLEQEPERADSHAAVDEG